jgi:hypothetical protein
MTSYLAIITSALVAVSGTVVAVSFDLLPERVDLVGFVLQGAGLGALVATALAVVRNAQKSERARWVEVGNAYGAAGALGVFLLVALIQEVS